MKRLHSSPTANFSPLAIPIALNGDCPPDIVLGSSKLGFSLATPVVNKNTANLLFSVDRTRSQQARQERPAASPTSTEHSVPVFQEEAQEGLHQLTPPGVPQVNLSDINLNQTPFICGGVANKIHEWEKYTKNPDILQSIRGVALNFCDPPVQFKLPHEIKFSGEQASLVEAEIQSLQLCQ